MTIVNPFRFKQFHVYDQMSTMKVGTDAVLLGAWSRPPHTGNILDIGTGCGILALMMAQKTNAEITAIDIHPQSVKQAFTNFSESPWKNRLNVLEISLESFSESNSGIFDFIISNPPFFINSLKPSKNNLLIAKHADIDFPDIFFGSIFKLLKPEGKAAFIIPYPELETVLQKLVHTGLNPYRIAEVFGKSSSKPIRAMLEITKDKALDIKRESIHIFNSDMSYSEKYKLLTNDFYLFLNQ
ncbi:MAG: methyltransferase [Bacteroidales bacterium]